MRAAAIAASQPAWPAPTTTTSYFSVKLINRVGVKPCLPFYILTRVSILNVQSRSQSSTCAVRLTGLLTIDVRSRDLAGSQSHGQENCLGLDRARPRHRAPACPALANVNPHRFEDAYFCFLDALSEALDPWKYSPSTKYFRPSRWMAMG